MARWRMSNDGIRNDGIREVPRDEWLEARKQRERERDAMQTPGDDWDLAREAFLRIDWLRKPSERRHVSIDMHVEIGVKIGVPDADVLEGGATLLEQSKRDLPPHLAEALGRVLAKAKPRKKGARKGAPKLTKAAVQQAFMAQYRVHNTRPTFAAVARALGVDPANFNPKKPARDWFKQAAELCDNQE